MNSPRSILVFLCIIGVCWGGVPNVGSIVDLNGAAQTIQDLVSLTSSVKTVTIPLSANGISNCNVPLNVTALVSFLLANQFAGAFACNLNKPGSIWSILPSQGTFGNCWNLQDFNGDYVCKQSCGVNSPAECQPEPAITSSNPVTVYPYQCQCPANGCNANGPMVQGIAPPLDNMKVKCQAYSGCACNDKSNKGYLCNWVGNTDSTTVPAQLSPVRWCSCCPQ